MPFSYWPMASIIVVKLKYYTILNGIVTSYIHHTVSLSFILTTLSYTIIYGGLIGILLLLLFFLILNHYLRTKCEMKIHWDLYPLCLLGWQTTLISTSNSFFTQNSFHSMEVEAFYNYYLRKRVTKAS